MKSLLDDASKARRQSMELQGVEFATELSAQLMDHSKTLEGIYTRMQGHLKDESVTDGKFKALFKKIDDKNRWFEEAEARLFLL